MPLPSALRRCGLLTTCPEGAVVPSLILKHFESCLKQLFCELLTCCTPQTLLFIDGASSLLRFEAVEPGPAAFPDALPVVGFISGGFPFPFLLLAQKRDTKAADKAG